MMTTDQIRQKFLNFFKSKNHAIIESDSVVPKDDPTVLFTTAGMQQFKRQFMGHIDDYRRAATCQKCIRTDDLDKIGITNFHHTFFEMLGNFSFGDYFKKDAIHWAWEFFTKELKLPAERLWVSVYKDDEEAYNIWLNEIKIPKEKIFKLGDKSNFWPSNAKIDGPNGPCGPCSEVFYDYDPKRGTFPLDPDDEGDRFTEVWNLVFTQFNRKEGGVLEPLPAKNIDTGMGLERLVSVMQDVRSNFDIDTFQILLRSIDEKVGVKDPVTGRKLRRVIADHIRAIVFGIADGVVPSNEGRGYIMKRLIIDISDIAITHGKQKPVIYELVPAVVEAMGGAYPYLREKQKNIADTIKNIEEGFHKTRKQKIPELEDKIKRIKQARIDELDKKIRSIEPEINEVYDQDEFAQKLGNLVFEYYDTHGLPLDTILGKVFAIGLMDYEESKVKEIFNNKMLEQKERSRAGSKMTGDVFVGGDLKLDVPKTNFLGYEQAEGTASVLKVFVKDQSVSEAKEGTEIKVVFDKTPFYAESGGQIGDTGVVHCERSGCEVVISDTQKTEDVFVHSGKVTKGSIKVNDVMKLTIDVDRRLSIMRNHTATHLMQAAMREILGSHIAQQGSLVTDERLRFDFTHPKAVTADEIKHIEDLVNVFIRSCDEVKKEYLPLEEARKTGALAFFAEKYGKTVRVVSVGAYSKEFCGGTHLASTGQIGLFKIISESAIAQGIRRIEAKTGVGALNFVREEEESLKNIAQVIKVPNNEIVERIKNQTQRMKELEKELQALRFESVKNSIDGLLEKSESFNGTKLIAHTFKDLDMGLLRQVVDLIKQKAKSAVIVLGAQAEDSASILVGVSDDLVQKGVKANELINEIAPLIDGQGGGRPQLAQAGSKSGHKVQMAITQANKILKDRFNR